ncbi:hypothetical protein GUI37_01735 [Helcococcus kunzii]|uniref:type II toxin-antitoxin system HicB family antitoxin n=1 Tax=Helcococcus kunzii TaxID=40091 RepID=UPI001BB00E80|nr:hypothetical protein [Helcococcus kunzii]QUY64304.1 hypothetical protein GUI37_01735 [Helcococcus kunzii]
MGDIELVAYPVYFKNTENGVIAWNDYIPVATQGKNLEEVLFMAKDAIELMAYDSYLEGESFIEPSEATGTEEDFDFDSYVIVDLKKYFRFESEKKVKKNCTIPESLAKAAEKKGINFSKILAKGIEKELSLM